MFIIYFIITSKKKKKLLWTNKFKFILITHNLLFRGYNFVILCLLVDTIHF